MRSSFGKMQNKTWLTILNPQCRRLFTFSLASVGEFLMVPFLFKLKYLFEDYNIFCFSLFLLGKRDKVKLNKKALNALEAQYESAKVEILFS